MRRIRLGLYDPDPDNNGVRWIGKTHRERDLPDLREAVREYNKEVAGRPDLTMCLGIFLVEPKRNPSSDSTTNGLDCTGQATKDPAGR